MHEDTSGQIVPVSVDISKFKSLLAGVSYTDAASAEFLEENFSRFLEDNLNLLRKAEKWVPSTPPPELTRYPCEMYRAYIPPAPADLSEVGGDPWAVPRPSEV